MIYLIGGAARVGKSNLAKRLLEKNKVPFFSTDALVHTLKKLAPNLGVTDELPYPEIGERFFPYLEMLVRHMGFGTSDYCFEGEVILPSFSTKLRDYDVRAIFLGNSNPNSEDLLKFVGPNDWISELSKERQTGLPLWITESSEFFKNECLKNEQPYIDLSEGYEMGLERAHNILVNKELTR